jgi:Ras-related C3 botulinum toxin substrate 1
LFQYIFIHISFSTGQEDYDRLRPLSYPETQVFLVCFSLISPVSYDNVRNKWAKEIKTHTQNVPMILVGLKLDMREDADIAKRLAAQDMAPITTEMGISMAKDIGAYSYNECSAKTQKGLNKVFNDAIECLYIFIVVLIDY